MNSEILVLDPSVDSVQDALQGSEDVKRELLTLSERIKHINTNHTYLSEYM